MGIYIDVVGTESFFNNWSSSGTDTKLQNVRDWCEQTWQNYIEDGSGSYDASFYKWSQSDVEIPNSAMCGCLNGSCCSLCDRMADQEEWLANNWSYYDSSDAVVIVDWYGNDSGTYGCGYVGEAGDDRYKTGTVDTNYEDTGTLPTELQNVESEGVGYHELLHVFNAQHPDDVSTQSDDDISLMYSWDGVSCSDNGSTEHVIRWNSSCAVSSVRTYIDNNSF